MTPDSYPIYVFAWMICCGPILLYGFHQYTLAIRIIREKYPQSFTELGSPADFLPPKPGSGDSLASQMLITKLIFITPKAIPNDKNVLKKIRIMQWSGRIWNLVGLPILIIFWTKKL